MKNVNSYIDAAKRTIAIEGAEIQRLEESINQDFVNACELILACEGRVIVTGMGKSGHICKKIAATFASTGTAAFFVHPGEASHGDLGMITAKDVVLALSNSGTTSEVLTIIPLIKRMGAKLIGMTGDPNSALAQASEAHLLVKVEKEACPLGLAPTSSTTAALVMGDALAVALLEAKGFSAEDFAFSHPGGALGRSLLLKVEDVMHAGEDMPQVGDGASLKEALLEMSRKKLGMTAIVDGKRQLVGIFTDGDLRRALDQDISVKDTPVIGLMTAKAKTVKPGMLAAQALRVMEDNKINALVVVNEQNVPVGALNMHDLLRAGVI